jgi:PIN domain nuclease of toxin-antitoxin system
MSIGRLKTQVTFDMLIEFLEENEIMILANAPAHLKILATLPFHHDDPFDRFILSQAIAEKAQIISIDSKFTLYNVDIVW